MAEVVTTVKRPTKGTEIEPGDPVEVEAVTGRPQDTPAPNTTFAERHKAREKVGKKQVAEAENKAVKSADTKASKR